MIQIKKVGTPKPGKPHVIKLSCTKQKDAEHFKELTLRLVTVELDQVDEEGEPLNSLVVDTIIVPDGQGRPSKEALDENGHTPACAALLKLITIGPLSSLELLTETGLPRATLYRYMRQMVETGFVYEKGKQWWPGRETN